MAASILAIGPVPMAAQLPLQPGAPLPADQAGAILRDRPPEAEAAARAFVFHIARARVGDGEGPMTVPLLDQLKRSSPGAYWQEVATLATQYDMFRRVVNQDSARAATMAGMMGTEFEARIRQRAWRTADETEKRALRGQLESLMARHFVYEDRLREMEINDIERRLNEAKVESARRRQRRDEVVRWSVEDIIRSAERPE